tara:strand:+ start:879 stop:1436 length:558 start_codon:yes stop_codon:yes gene_type:complete
MTKKLPKWKKVKNEYNEKHHKKLIEFIEKTIPWLVLVLLFVLLGEFGHDINHYIESMGFHEWQWLNSFSDYLHHHHWMVVVFDYIIIAFFVGDLYFGFWKYATTPQFIRGKFIDILAILPVGLMTGTIKLTTQAQEVFHAAVDTEKIAVRSLEASKVTKASKGVRLFTRAPRMLRIFRLREFLKK